MKSCTGNFCFVCAFERLVWLQQKIKVRKVLLFEVGHKYLNRVLQCKEILFKFAQISACVNKK